MGQHELGFEKGLTDGNPATCVREDEKDPFAEENLLSHARSHGNTSY